MGSDKAGPTGHQNSHSLSVDDFNLQTKRLTIAKIRNTHINATFFACGHVNDLNTRLGNIDMYMFENNISTTLGGSCQNSRESLSAHGLPPTWNLMIDIEYKQRSALISMKEPKDTQISITKCRIPVKQRGFV